MLNQYHLQFLSMLDEQCARAIIIGGQARYFHLGTSTRDLDLWADVADSRSQLESALFLWKCRYSAHSILDLEPPVALRPAVQIKFPDADALFINSDGELSEILIEDGIDLLTSVGAYNFDLIWKSSVDADLGLKHVKMLCRTDLDIISPGKSSDTLAHHIHTL